VNGSKEGSCADARDWRAALRSRRLSMFWALVVLVSCSSSCAGNEAGRRTELTRRRANERPNDGGALCPWDAKSVQDHFLTPAARSEFRSCIGTAKIEMSIVFGPEGDLLSVMILDDPADKYVANSSCMIRAMIRVWKPQACVANRNYGVLIVAP
jgi:hypothetical protein